MDKKPEHLYLDLMKKTLCFTLWPEPPILIETFNYLRSAPQRLLVSFVSSVLRTKGLQLVKNKHFEKDDRYEGRIWPQYAHTMIGIKRLDNIQSAIETVIREGVEGDLIETGVWRGGA
jgi:O-methyltransferase